MDTNDLGCNYPRCPRCKEGTLLPFFFENIPNIVFIEKEKEQYKQSFPEKMKLLNIYACTKCTWIFKINPDNGYADWAILHR